MFHTFLISQKFEHVMQLAKKFGDLVQVDDNSKVAILRAHIFVYCDQLH